ncbi:DNA-methyltransferase [Lignipirellula cremea]|uniref:Methyltransferase n=1 Tax=Lignipirellula cremea TaxID=2528010 RepID=A0A518DWS5_9BACT|nr:site-specific DNA-methyltransferase [Lignipirellula cremea]QDU96287.1 Modification methylase DpnIIB [Lignipirellula cremea]
MQWDSILVGDVCEVAAGLPEQCVQCVVTSPPYFGHRKYSDGDDPREIGREATVEAYLERLVEALRAVRRLLRDDGVLWLNLGDTYRRKQLLGVPWRAALALQNDGWKLRSDIIWHKPNAMPSAVKNRPTVDHEYLFLLARSDRYYYDADAIREPHVTFSEQSKMKGGRRHFGVRGGTPEEGKFGQNHNLHDARWDQAFHPEGRNKRTVWSAALGKCREAHFAVFPEPLIAPCIAAGCPPGGVVLDPFFGAGTVGIAARRQGRHYLGIELMPHYAELSRKRIDQFEQEFEATTDENAEE